MQTSITELQIVADKFFVIVLIVLAVLAVLCFVRAILGPRVADRLVAINMLGTIIIVMVGILAVKLREGYLMDIALIYALISFLATISATRVYMVVVDEKRKEKEKKHGHS